MLSYNLNALPWGAGLLGGPGHDWRQQRLSEFVEHAALRGVEVLLLQEVFATPLLRALLCSQSWLRRQLAAKGFVHQVVSPFRAGLRSWTDSGLLIASKLPIMASGFTKFKRGRHLDAGAAKGIMYARVQAGSRDLFVFNTHLQASHRGSGGRTYRQLRAHQLRQLREFVDATTRHSRVPWVLAGDFNVDAVADQAVADAFGYLCDALPQESDEFRQMQQALNSEGGSGAGSVRDLLKETAGHHPSTRPPRLQFPRKTSYVFKHKYPQRLDYLFFCDAHCLRSGVTPKEGGTRLVEFETAVPAIGPRPPYTHLSDHYGIASVFCVENDFCWEQPTAADVNGDGLPGGEGTKEPAAPIARTPLQLAFALSLALALALAVAAGLLGAASAYRRRPRPRCPRRHRRRLVLADAPPPRAGGGRARLGGRRRRRRRRGGGGGRRARLGGGGGRRRRRRGDLPFGAPLAPVRGRRARDRRRAARRVCRV